MAGRDKKIYTFFKLVKARLLKLLIIPFLITFGYFTLVSYPYFNSKINRYDSLGPFSLVEEEVVNLQKTLAPDRKTDQFDNHLFKGEKMTGKVKSSENNVGILLFRFAKLADIVSDKIVFRIKEEGRQSWYYENKYEAKQFQDNQYFTFGFPPIAKSKGNLYIFEIESLSGTYKNGIGVSPVEPKVALVYKYTQNELKNYKTLSYFTFKKFVYVVNNVNYSQVLITFTLSLFFVFLMMKKNITIRDAVRFLLIIKNNPRRALRIIIIGTKSIYLLQEKKLLNFTKELTQRFSRTNIYIKFFNTNTKKRLSIGLLIFLLALTYRFSSSLINQHLFFYAGLGGQGDYDQFIRAATCALKFCSYAILGQNFLFESIILGIFYEIWGFTGALKAYLYFMIILSSAVATIPHFLLSRKGFFSIGGIIGSLYLVFSDFLTWISLNFTPDNGSLFSFSIFYIVYFLTIHKGTFRWLLLFGAVGAIDALNKALFILNDLVALALFIPVLFYEKAKIKGYSLGKRAKSLFQNKNKKILFLYLLPFLVFLLIYSLWEYIVYLKFSAPYFLRGLLISGGKSYVYYTSFDDSSFTQSLASQLLYLSVSAVVMVKRLIDHADLRIIYLAPIFLGLLYFSFINSVRIGDLIKKLTLLSIFSIALAVLMILIKNNNYNIHQVFTGEYISKTWTFNIYVQIFLMSEIIVLFILNFKYPAIKLSLPIIPYVVMLIILTKDSPFPRLHTHVVAWSIILLAFIIDFLMTNVSRKRIRVIIAPIILFLFVYVYLFPKIVTMVTQLNSGFAAKSDQIRYIKWVEGSIPANAVILAGGKSDVVILAENIKRSIIYNSVYSAAVLIKPREIPGVKPTDFEVANVPKHTYNLKINEVPGVTPSDFSIVKELKSKDNFKKKKYIILEDDIYVWRARISGVADNVFFSETSTPSALYGDDYSIKVYKFNPTLKKAIYELNLRNKDSLSLTPKN